MTDIPIPPPSGSVSEREQLRASLAAIDSQRYAFAQWTNRIMRVEAKSQFLADYALYLLDRIDALEARQTS